MLKRAAQFSKISLLLLFILSTVACTTTTKKLTTTKPRVDSTSQMAKAREAFNQNNYQQAAELLAPLAEQGDASAQYALGYMYHNGLGVPRNYKLAIQWMTAASAKGNEKATEALRRISALGSDVTDNNITEESTQPETEAAEPILITGEKTKSAEMMEETELAKIQAMETPDNTAESISESDMPAISTTEPEEQETPAPATSITTETALSVDEKWIMEQPKTNYTIQLIATGKESALKQFISENSLQDGARYYKSLRNNKDWFTLIQGSFDSSTTAKNAIKELAPGLQDMNPWVKPFSDIQEALSNR